MLTPAVLFALFLVFLGLTWTLSLAESAFSYLSRRDAEDIVRERPGSKVLEIARERESHLGALRVWRFVAEALSAVCLTAAATRWWTTRGSPWRSPRSCSWAWPPCWASGARGRSAP
ncbi:hypothetical protein GQ85_38180, partial [Rhodococcus rhodochrous]